MCDYYHSRNFDGYYHHINPNQLCRVTFSFGFYVRNNHNGQNPYGLAPMPAPNLYNGPFNVRTGLQVNLRIKCQQQQQHCNQNINLAQQIHALWNGNNIWETHPAYFNSPNDRGVDFIAEPVINVLFIRRGNQNPFYRRIIEWLIENLGDDVDVIEADEIPENAFDLGEWIMERVQEINDLGPLGDYLEENGLNPIPIPGDLIY